MRVDPGELNKKIKILKGLEDDQEYADGYPTENTETIRKCWARVTHESGSEAMKQDTLVARSKARFLIRKTSKEVTTDMYIMYAGKRYDIVYVRDYDDPYTEIIAERNG